MREIQEGKNTINAAIVGLGNYAGVLTSKLIESGLYEIRWCVHYQKEKADHFAATYNSTGCDNFDLVLNDPTVNAVFVLTPNDSHFELVRQTLLADKHVFVEKPMTNTINEAMELGEILEEKEGLVFMVGHNYRRKNGIRFIKQLIADGKLGIPVHFEMVISHGGAFNFEGQSWRNDPQRCFGGPLSMLGSHSFEVLQYLLGEPSDVYSITQCSQSLFECDDSSICLLRMNSGATAILKHHYVVPSLGYLRLEGTEGTATYEIDSNEVFLRTGRDVNCVPSPTQKYSLSPVDDRLEQVIEFARAIKENSPIETGYSVSYSVVNFIEKAMESSRSRSVIAF